jgi:predicted transcriptional regulator
VAEFILNRKRKRSMSFEEILAKSLTEEKSKQTAIFKNINTNSSYLKNLICNSIYLFKTPIIENNDQESASRKTSLFFSDDLLGYNLKSMRLNVKEQDYSCRKPSF